MTSTPNVIVETFRRAARGLIHDIRTPLATLGNELFVLQDSLGPDSIVLRKCDEIRDLLMLYDTAIADSPAEHAAQVPDHPFLRLDGVTAQLSGGLPFSFDQWMLLLSACQTLFSGFSRSPEGLRAPPSDTKIQTNCFTLHIAMNSSQDRLLHSLEALREACGAKSSIKILIADMMIRLHGITLDILMSNDVTIVVFKEHESESSPDRR